MKFHTAAGVKFYSLKF